jgi:7-cyano-7-deazaguanine synthase in queuosine biosynthesis
MKKIVVLYSGGLDSFVLYHLAKTESSEVTAIYYQHGCDSEESELASLPDFVEVRKVDWLNENCRPLPKKSDPVAGAIYIPGRNLIFSALAASQELPDEVWMGTTFDEDNQQATDKNEYFRSETSKLLTYVLSPFIDSLTVKFPFVERQWSKQQIVLWALSNGLKDGLLKTISCWFAKDGIPCGLCKQCFKRALVMKIFNITEKHSHNPLHLSNCEHYVREYCKLYGDGIANADELNVYNLMKAAGLI